MTLKEGTRGRIGLTTALVMVSMAMTLFITPVHSSLPPVYDAIQIHIGNSSQWNPDVKPAAAVMAPTPDSLPSDVEQEAPGPASDRHVDADSPPSQSTRCPAGEQPNTENDAETDTWEDGDDDPNHREDNGKDYKVLSDTPVSEASRKLSCRACGWNSGGNGKDYKVLSGTPVSEASRKPSCRACGWKIDQPWLWLRRITRSRDASKSNQ
ncbi:hypothetical protein ACRALDRAFT_1083558 [Sodiomyces alcalophilus JCM 7366]|uniref:uncharacterized protein n=1 Tax=Sodiomyces alcalophilus JCM 7366 TaxID=591952 RepID=UPI0039B61C85